MGSSNSILVHQSLTISHVREANDVVGLAILRKVMKSITTIILLPCFLLGCKADTNSAASGNDRILGLPHRIELGTIFPGTSAWIKLTVSNTSNKEFYLFDTTTSCGCMLARFSPKLLHPGDELPVEILMVPKGRRGPIREKVRFFSSNDTLTQHEVIILATSIGDDLIVPGVEFDLFTPELGTSQRVNIEVTEQFFERYADTIARVEPRFLCEDSALPVYVDGVAFPVVGGQRYLTFIVGIEPCSRRGLFDTTLRLFLERASDNSSGVHVEFPIHGACLPYLYSEPSVLDLSRLAGDHFEVTVRSTEQANVTFSTVSGAAGPLRWKLDTSSSKIAIEVLRDELDAGVELEDIHIPFQVEDSTLELVVPVFRQSQ